LTSPELISIWPCWTIYFKMGHWTLSCSYYWGHAVYKYSQTNYL